MFFSLSKILYFLVSPTIWIVVFFLLFFFSKKPERKKKFFISGLIMLLVFTNPFIINFILQRWEIPAVKMEDIKQPYEAGIMLGGAIRYYNNDVKRPVYGMGVDRFFNVIELYKSGKIKKIILVGGSGSMVYKDVREADVLQSELLKMGVDSSAIITENESKNTFENAVNCVRIIKQQNMKGKFLLVTSAFHMRRSLACFEKAGLKVDPFPVDQRSGKYMLTPDKLFIPDPERLQDWELLIHEWVGFIAYKFSGYI